MKTLAKIWEKIIWEDKWVSAAAYTCTALISVPIAFLLRKLFEIL